LVFGRPRASSRLDSILAWRSRHSDGFRVFHSTTKALSIFWRWSPAISQVACDSDTYATNRLDQYAAVSG